MLSLTGFDQWKAKVNTAFSTQFGIEADDMPDQEYRAWYDAGLSVSDVVKITKERITNGEL
jgi:hypothetical protein